MTNALEDDTKIYFCLLEYEAGTVRTGQQGMSISGVWAQCRAIYQVVFAVCWMYRCSRTIGKDFCVKYSMLLEKGTPAVAIYRSFSGLFALYPGGSILEYDCYYLQ